MDFRKMLASPSKKERVIGEEDTGNKRGSSPSASSSSFGNGPAPPTITSANHYDDAAFSNPINAIGYAPPLFSQAIQPPPEIEVIVKCPNCGSKLHHGKKQTSLVHTPGNFWCQPFAKMYTKMTTGNYLFTSANSSGVSHGGGYSNPSFPNFLAGMPAGGASFPQEGFQPSPNLTLQVQTEQQDTNCNYKAERRREQVRDVKVGQNVIVKDVPKSYGVYKTYVHERQRKSHDELLRNRRLLQKQVRHVSTAESRSYLGKVASEYPEIASPKFQALYAHSVCHFLNHTLDFKIDDKGSQVPFDNVLRVAPNTSTISSAVSLAVAEDILEE
jgi:hypothetical protein